jgi:hypothetical protein
MVTAVNRCLGVLQYGGWSLRALWVDVTTALDSIVRSAARERPAVYASGVSQKWLRSNEIESAKHSDDR